MNELIKKVQKMELGNPIITTLIGLVVFYIGLKMFSGGMKSMGNIEHLAWFTGNYIYMFFGGIVMTLLWQSSSLSTTAIIALVASGAVPLPAAIAAVLGANIGTTSGSGGSGIVIIKVPDANYATSTLTGSPSTSQSCGFTTLTWTSSGSYTA